MQKYHYIFATLMALAVLSILVAISDLVWGLDCSHKPPCPPGTTAQESISCEACCPDGSFIKTANDPYCCPQGHTLSPDNKRCLPDGYILKSDGSCYVMNEADQCCPDGWYVVSKYDCCPTGYTLAIDNDNCCTQRADGKCCAEKFVAHPLTGACIPPRPVGVMIR